MKSSVFALIAIIASALLATVTNPGYVPATDTTVTTASAQLSFMHLNNKSNASSDCVVKDRSTNCGGAACPLWGPATLGASGSAGSVVSWDFHGTPAPSGFTWSCSTSSAVVGTITYK